MQAIIMAGGKGARLKPFTTTIPKPLMPLGETPIIEVVIRQLKRDGFDDIIIAVNHLKDIVRAFLDNGEKWGVEISYSVEDEFLGTAGPLKMIDSLDDNFLVVNGDVLATIDYAEFFKFHCNQKAAATIATTNREMRVDFGVVTKDEEGRLLRFVEKPVHSFEVSIGINAFHRSVLASVPKGKRLDLPELISKLKDGGKRILIYPFKGQWLDIGHIADYETANTLFERDKDMFLKGGT